MRGTAATAQAGQATAGGAPSPGVSRVDVVLVVVALTAVSTSGPLIAATAVPALALAFWRNALAAGLLLPVALVTCRDELRGLSRRELRWAGLAGAMLALHFATWTPSLGLTSVASATALVATQPVWAALIAGRRGTPVGPAVWAGIAIAMAGALLLVGVDVRLDDSPLLSGGALLGDLLALAGGAFAALYMTAGSEVRRSVSTTTYTLLCYSVTAALLLVVCLAARSPLSGYSGKAWLQVVALTVGAQLLGHSLFNRVLPKVGPTVVSMLILLEIPGAAVLAAVFLGQTPPLLALPAAVLLLAGLALVIRASGRGTEPSVPAE